MHGWCKWIFILGWKMLLDFCLENYLINDSAQNGFELDRLFLS